MSDSISTEYLLKQPVDVYLEATSPASGGKTQGGAAAPGDVPPEHLTQIEALRQLPPARPDLQQVEQEPKLEQKPAPSFMQDFLNKSGVKPGPQFPLTQFLDHLFPPEQKSFVLDAVRGLARGVDATLSTSTQGLGDLGLILIKPISDALRAGGADEAKVSQFQEGARFLLESAGAFLLPPGAAAGPLKAAQPLKSAVGLKPLQTMPDGTTLREVVPQVPGSTSVAQPAARAASASVGSTPQGDASARAVEKVAARNIPPMSRLQAGIESLTQEGRARAARMERLYRESEQALTESRKTLGDEPAPVKPEPPLVTPDVAASASRPFRFSQETATATKGGGATFHPEQGNLQGQPYFAVATHPERNQKLPVGQSVTPEGVSRFYQKNLDVFDANPHLSVGTWLDSETGITHLDVVSTVPDKSEAYRLGRLYNQKAIYDLSTGTELKVEPARRLERYMPSDVGDTLDPSNPAHRAGTRQGGEYRRLFGDKDAPARLYYYPEGTTPEPGVGRGVKYTASVWPERLYNISTDAEKLARPDATEMERLINGQGYAGYYSDQYPIVAMFEPLEAVEKLDTRTPLVKQMVEAIKSGPLGNEFGAVMAKLPYTRKAMELAKQGAHGAYWYRGVTEELQKHFGDEWEMVADMIAIASPGTHVSVHLDVALDAFTRWKSGQPLRQIAEELVVPGKSGGMIKLNIVKRLDGYAMDQIFSPDALKVLSFAKALKGDMQAVVVDRWMWRTFYPAESKLAKAMFDAGKRSSPDYDGGPARYRLIESWVRANASKVGLEPSEFQAAIWVAKKMEEGYEKGLGQYRDMIREKWVDGFLPRIAGLDEEGQVNVHVLTSLAQIVAGSALGMSQGDTLEERLRNGFIGAGVGAALNPTLLKQAVKFATELGAAGHVLLPGKAAFRIVPGSPEQVKQFLETNADAVQLGTKTLAFDWSVIAQEASDLDGMLKKMVASIGMPAIDAARRDVITDVARKQLAQTLGLSIQDFAKIPEGTALNAEQLTLLLAMVKGNLSALSSAVEQVGALAAHSPMAAPASQKLAEAWGAARALILPFYGARAEWGRAGRVLGEVPSDLQAQLELVLDAEKAMQQGGHALQPAPAPAAGPRVGRQAPANQPPAAVPGGPGTTTAAPPTLTPQAARVLSQALSQLPTLQQGQGFLAGLMQHGPSMIAELWYNSMLSGPTTHAANTISGFITTSTALAERAMGSAIGAARSAGSIALGRGPATDRVYGHEVLEAVHAIVGGQLDAIRSAAMATVTRQSNFGGSKDIPEAAITAKNLSLDGTITGAAVDWIGAAVRLPSHFLQGADEYHKAVNFRIALRSLAYRRAAAKGLRGARLTTEVERLQKFPDTDLVEAAVSSARDQTFTRELEGKLASAADALSSPAAKVIVPFFRTPTNIARYTFERLPGLSFAVKQWRQDFAAGGARRDMALAKNAFGASMLAIGSSLAAGGYITGRGPADPKQLEGWKRAGNQPYSIKLGDAWYSYNRYDPVGTYLALAADYSNLSGYMQADESMEVAVAMGLATSSAFLSKTYVENVAKLLDAVTERGSPDSFASKAAKELLGIGAKGSVPAAVAQFTRQTDPVIRETHGLLDRIAERTPWGSKSLMPERNLKGDPVLRPAGVGAEAAFWLASSQAKPDDDKVWQELFQNEVNVSPLPKHIYGSKPGLVTDTTAESGIQLTARQYDDYQRWAGNELKDASGKGMWDHLREQIDSQTYQHATPAVKKLVLSTVIQAFRSASRAKLLAEYPDLVHALVTKRIAQGEALEPGIGKTLNVQDILKRSLEGLR